MNHDELIAALEAADEGSRELDDAIADAIWGQRQPITRPGGHMRMCWQRDTAFPCSISPYFTTSLDAAVTLVPDGWEWHVSASGKVVVRIDESGLDEHYIQANARTPALALCIAALRARRRG